MTDTVYNKERFITLLKTTNRAGVDKIIAWLESTDFFEAPASTQYHENYTGGLCEHSLKVYDTFKKLHKAFNLDINVNSIIIMSLLHDVCKAGCYHKEKKNVKIGQNWTQVDYWKFDDNNPIGHGHKSVILLQQFGLTLNDLEIQSIITHMNGYEESKYFSASNVYSKDNLTLWLHIADLISAYYGNKI